MAELQRSYSELAEREAWFRLLADTAPVLVWTAGPDALCNYFNRPWLEFTGRTQEQELGNGWAEGVHPDDYQRCLDIYLSSFEARQPFRMEYRLRRRDGEHRWILDHGVPLVGPDGAFLGYIGSCVDIHERVLQQEALEENAEHLEELTAELEQTVEEMAAQRRDALRAGEALRQSEERFRILAEAIAAVVWTTGPEGGFVAPQAEWEEYTGQGWPEQSGWGWAKMIHPEDVDELRARWAAALAERTPYEAGGRIWHAASGRYRYFRVQAVPIAEKDGTVREWVGIVEDTDERCRAERAQRFLADAGAVFASSLDPELALRDLAGVAVGSIADYCVTYLLDDGGRIRRVGAAHSEAAGAEVIQEVYRLLPPDPAGEHGVPYAIRSDEPVFTPEITDELLKTTAQDPDHLRLLRALSPRSSMIVPLSVRGNAFGAIAVAAVEGGRPPYMEQDFAALREVARRAALAIDNARLYLEAQRANRAKADFLAVMSHELRTPLNAILGYAGLISDGIPDPPTAAQAQHLNRIRSSALHLVELVDEILDYAKTEAGRQEVQPEPVRLGDIVRDAVAHAEPSINAKGLSLDVAVADETVVTDRGKLRQIVLNLLSNAAKFTLKGGIQVRGGAEGDELKVSVSDTGEGIRAADLERIFEPFTQLDQSQTRLSGGTGLGLTVARRLARLLGGDVRVESEPGRGSTFTVALPRALPPGGAETAPIPGQ